MTQRRSVLGLFTLMSSAAMHTATAQIPAGLRDLSTVRIVESDSLFLARPIEITLGPGGHVFVTEAKEARVLDIGPSGRIERAFGRQGRGPGEFVSPSTLAVGGDSLLIVFDRGQRRVTYVRLPSWTLGPIVLLPEAWPPTMRVVNGAVLVRSYDWDSKTSLAQLDSAGTLVDREGVIPEIGLKYPMLIQGAFPRAVFTVIGAKVFAMFEVSPSLYEWERGSRTAREIDVPAPRRRGVRTSLFEQMLQNPNSPRMGELIYDRSIPFALEAITDSLLAIVTMDLTITKDSKTVVYHLTLVDVQRRRVCPDLLIPLSRTRMPVTDPAPLAAVRGDTLVILDEVADAHGEPGPALRRFRIEPSRCGQWIALPQ